MTLFQTVEDAFVILLSRGIYRQVNLVSKGPRLFAEHRKGEFVQLRTQGDTSLPHCRWDSLEGCEFSNDKMGRLVTAGWVE